MSGGQGTGDKGQGCLISTEFPQQPVITIHELSAEERAARGVTWLYKLEADFIYTWMEGGFGRRIVAPAGFLYDGASVPRWAWTASGITPAGPVLAAATIHDLLYANHGLPPEAYCELRDGKWEPLHRFWTRAEADAMFREILERTNLYAAWQVAAAYVAVRIGGRKW